MTPRILAGLLSVPALRAQTTPTSPITIPLIDTKGNLNVGNTTGMAGGPNGAVTLFGTGGGSVQLTVPSTAFPTTVLTLPGITGGAGNVVVDTANNVFSGTLVLPNTATNFTGSTPLGQVAYYTAQQQFISQGNQNQVGSFQRTIFFTAPADDLVCSLVSGTSISTALGPISCNGSTTLFTTTYAIPSHFLLLNKTTRFTGSFSYWTGSTADTFSVTLKVGAAAVYSSSAATSVAAGITNQSFLWTWDVVALQAPGPTASTDTSSTFPAVPGAPGANMVNHAGQPVQLPTDGSGGLTLTFNVGWSANHANNALQLQWLRVEEIN